MLPKAGNSDTKERIELLELYIHLFGIETIDCLEADREFVGKQWIDFLNNRGIRYHIRIHDNFWITMPRNKHQVKARWLFNDLRMNKSRFHPTIVSIHGQYCYLSGSLIKNKDGCSEFQIIASFN